MSEDTFTFLLGFYSNKEFGISKISLTQTSYLLFEWDFLTRRLFLLLIASTREIRTLVFSTKNYFIGGEIWDFTNFFKIFTKILIGVVRTRTTNIAYFTLSAFFSEYFSTKNYRHFSDFFCCDFLKNWWALEFLAFLKIFER